MSTQKHWTQKPENKERVRAMTAKAAATRNGTSVHHPKNTTIGAAIDVALAETALTLVDAHRALIARIDQRIQEIDATIAGLREEREELNRIVDRHVPRSMFEDHHDGEHGSSLADA